MKRLFLALAALAAFGFSPARAAPPAPVSAYLPTVCSPDVPGVCQRAMPITNPDGSSIAKPTVATSTACSISATTTAITPTGCTATGSAGAYVAGPFAAQAGYPVRLVATGTWAGSIAVGTSVNNCATVNPLTIAGQAWGVYTTNANEAVDVPPTTGSVVYCLTVSVTSGTLNAALRQ